jgi:hypothetical protein
MQELHIQNGNKLIDDTFSSTFNPLLHLAKLCQTFIAAENIRLLVNFVTLETNQENIKWQ